MTEKVGRNDPCPCGSGKKYKKCCEARLGKKRFNASIISSGKTSEGISNKATKISANFFSKRLAPIPEKQGVEELEEALPPPDEKKELPRHPPEADKPM